MKASTVDYSAIPEPYDVPKRVRGIMAEERVTASDLARTFGGAVTYWTNRLNARYTFTPGDLQAVALMCRRHPAEFMGGQPPAGWTPPPTPLSDQRATMGEGARSSTDRASDYGSLVRWPGPIKPVLTLIRGGAA